MTTRSDRRLALIVGAALAVFFVIGSALQVASWTIGSVARQQVVRFGDQVIHGPVRALTIDARSADVELVPSDTGEVVIDSRASGTLRTPKLQVRPEGSRVQVSGGCPDLTLGHCSAEIVVHVPASTAVNVDAGTGDISADGVAGSLNLRSASGDIVGADLRGAAVQLRSASGDVSASGMHSLSVVARTNSGDVTVQMATVPESVEAKTDSGDVAVLVPPGGVPYRIDAETDSGDRSVGVAAASDSARTLSVHTHSGDVLIGYQ